MGLWRFVFQAWFSASTSRVLQTVLLQLSQLSASSCVPSMFGLSSVANACSAEASSPQRAGLLGIKVSCDCVSPGSGQECGFLVLGSGGFFASLLSTNWTGSKWEDKRDWLEIKEGRTGGRTGSRSVAPSQRLRKCL